VARLGTARAGAERVLDARRARAVALELCPALGISIPVGKDSMSMRTTWREGGETREVIAPLSLIVTAFAPCEDARRTLTPQLRADRGTTEQERSVALVGFGHEQVTSARVGSAPRFVRVAPDHVRRVQSRPLQDQGDHRGGGGLAVGSRDRHLAAVRGGGGERLGPRPDRHPSGASLP